MIKTIALSLFITLSLCIKAQTVTKEGSIIEFKQKYPNADYLGFSGEHFLSFVLEKKDNFSFKFIKADKKTLSLISSKDLVIPFDPYKFHSMQENCAIDVFYKQNKVFILYSLLDTKGKTANFRIFLKVLDENFEEISSEQIGSIDDTGYNNQGAYEVVFSPDNKTMLLVLKNTCEKRKALVGNYSVYENSELIWMNLETGKKTFSKFLPVENGDIRLKTQDYRISNNGNLAFILTHHNIQEHSRTNGIFIAFNEFAKEKFTTHEIKLNGKDSSFSHSLTQIQNEKAAYLCKTNYRYLYKTINISKGTVDLDNQFTYKKSEYGEPESDVKEIIEKDDFNYFICYRTLYNPINGNFLAPTVFKTTKQGELIWARNLPKKTLENPAYAHLYNSNLHDAKLIVDNTTIQLIYLEDNKKPATLSGNTYNARNQLFIIGHPMAYSNLVSYQVTLDKGDISKKELFKNTRDLGIVPYYGYLMMENGELLFNFSGPKQVRFATMKL